jgi:hypothetical protein
MGALLEIAVMDNAHDHGPAPGGDGGTPLPLLFLVFSGLKVHGGIAACMFNSNTIKMGSHVSSLIALLVDSSSLCILDILLFV